MFDVMGTAIAMVMCVQPPVGDASEGDAGVLEPAPVEPSSETVHDGWDDPAPVEPPAPVLESAPPQPEGPTPAELEQKKARARARGMLIGGWTTFGITYAAALTIGVASIDLAKDDNRQRMWGRRMAIPIGGPFAAAFVSDSATGTLFTVLTGAAQTTGLALGIAGAVMLAKQKQTSNLAFAVVPDPTGVRMGATWRF